MGISSSHGSGAPSQREKEPAPAAGAAGGWLTEEEEEEGVQTTIFPDLVPVARARPDPGGHHSRWETGSGQPERRRIEWSCEGLRSGGWRLSFFVLLIAHQKRKKHWNRNAL